jgi:hypothetical protein
MHGNGAVRHVAVEARCCIARWRNVTSQISHCASHSALYAYLTAQLPGGHAHFAVQTVFQPRMAFG